MISIVLSALALSFAGQFAEGSAVSGPGCVSAITGQQSNVVASTVMAFHDAGAQVPKQGEIFFVAVNVASFSQPCATSLSFRPGFKLPANVSFVPPGANLNAPRPECYIGRPGQLARVINGCPLDVTATLPDGTILFDETLGNGLWSVADGQQLQIKIPVRSTSEHPIGFAGITNVGGYVDWAAPDGFSYNPLRPSVQLRVYFNRPTITYPAPAVSDVGPYSAAVSAFVDPHFNAGRVDLEVAPVGGAFVVADTASHDGSLFELDVASVVDNLDADTDYQWRYKYTVTRNGEVVTGAAQRFRTLPPPRFAFSSTVTGGGRLVASPVVEPDGTFIDRTEVTLQAIADEGYELASFVVDGAAVVGDSVTFVVRTPVSASATFVEQPPASEGEGEGEGEGKPAEGEGEGEGEPAEGEGESDPEPAEGEGEGETEPAEGEGEGEPAQGEGEGEGEDEGDGGESAASCASAGGAVWLAVLALVRRRR